MRGATIRGLRAVCAGSSRVGRVRRYATFHDRMDHDEDGYDHEHIGNCCPCLAQKDPIFYNRGIKSFKPSPLDFKVKQLMWNRAVCTKGRDVVSTF
eukprot:TRINITY_DN2879_c0_g1_i1.p1 TRINITY_DN2879_c0_g1~~TRINITY_DN2879_c0_g1_i1.p1  ORF type:complete len:106 (-),score=17.16 TRINITY_DN2879_c0_g1_i1:78-365(-)